MTVLIDVRYVGVALGAAQQCANLSTAEIAEILNVAKRDWKKYCRGTVPIPQQVLIRVLDAGLSFMVFRYRVCPSVRDIKRRRRK